MSAITVGRFGLDTDTPSLTSWTEDGSTVTITGVNWTPGILDGRAMRQQILGLASTPADLVPVTSTDDPSRNGFYSVVAASVSSERLWLVDGHLSWTMTLNRPPGYATMRAEIVTGGGTRGGKPAGITALHWLGIPSGYGYAFTTGNPDDVGDRYLVGGELMAIPRATHLTPRSTARCVGSLDVFYVGAVRFRQGDPLRDVIGRQPVLDVDNWELSNGFVTVRPGVADSALFSIGVRSVSTASTTTVFHDVEVGVQDPGWVPSTDHQLLGVSVLRDTVEEVVIRLTGLVNLTGTTFPRNSFAIDLGLRRGALGIDVHYEYGEAGKYGIGWVTTTASAAITADNVGIRASSASADGTWPMIVHPGPGFAGSFTRNTSAGRVYFTPIAYNAADVFIGASDETGAASTAAVLQAQWFSTVRGRQRMVAA